MLANTATKDFAIKHAVCLEKQMQAGAADYYGGSAARHPGEGDLLPAEANAEFQTGAEYYTDASMNGTQFSGDKRKTAELPSVASLNVKGYTQGLERLLYSALGKASVAGPVPAAQTGFYRHLLQAPQTGKNQRAYTAEEEAQVTDGTYDPADIINTYIIVSQKLGPYARHARNVAIKDLEISCSAKSPLQLTVSGTADRIDRDDTLASAADWDYPEGAFAAWFQMSDFKCYLYPSDSVQTAAISITDFSAKYSHGLAEDNVPTGTSNSGLSRAEPLPAGKSTLTLELTIYLHDKTLYEDWQNAETPLQCRLEGARGNYSINLLFPRLAIAQSEPNFDNAGSVKLSLEGSFPSDPAAIAALADSFGAFRGSLEWAEPSIFGIVVQSKEGRNPVRWADLPPETPEVPQGGE